MNKVPKFDHSNHETAMSIDWSVEDFFRTANWISFYFPLKSHTFNQKITLRPTALTARAQRKSPLTEAKTGFQTFGTVTALLTRRARLKEFVSQKKVI